MRRLWMSALALVVTLACASPAAAGARATKLPSVPIGFIGMNLGDALQLSGVSPAQQLDRVVAAGVGSVRVTFDWATAQPYGSWLDVPSALQTKLVGDPVPTSFAATDEIVAMAARRRLAVLPVVIDAPAWDAAPTTQMVAPPSDFAPYVAYVRALVERYGAHGSFWAQNTSIPYEPIRQWQIWNEPDMLQFWPIAPWAATYALLLEQTSKAIKAIDPGAKVILAGLPDFAWNNLKAIYAVHGARGAFDAVAVHPYTKSARGVITILTRVRAVMDQNGDSRKPLLATELGWPSAAGVSSQKFDFSTTQQGQARKLDALMPLIARYRKRLGLAGFDYYTWMDHEFSSAPAFNFAGLFAYEDNASVVTKPAYSVFRRWALRLTGCRAKGPVATACLRR